MPWKECHVMDERLQFVARLLDGEKMVSLHLRFPRSPGRNLNFGVAARRRGIHGVDHQGGVRFQ